MAQHQYSRNAPCPCGSGKKYKHCCWGKGFTWAQDEQGHTFRDVPLPAETSSLLEQQQDKFRQHFGRDPGPEDPTRRVTRLLNNHKCLTIMSFRVLPPARHMGGHWFKTGSDDESM